MTDVGRCSLFRAAVGFLKTIAGDQVLGVAALLVPEGVSLQSERPYPQTGLKSC